MSKTFLVAQREFLENLRTKTFWFGILAAPIGLVLFYGMMFLLADKTDVRKYVVLDESRHEELGEDWLSRAVFERAAAEFLRTRARQAINDEIDRHLPPDRPLRQLIEAEKGPGKSIADWFFGLGDDPLQALQEAKALRDRIAVRLEALLAATPAAERPGLEARLAADEQAMAAFARELAVRLAELRESEDIHKAFERVPFAEQGEDSEKLLRQMIRDGEIFAYFVVGPDPLAGPEGSNYVSNNVTDSKLRDWFTRHATEVVRDQHVQRLKREKSLADADVAAIRGSFSFPAKDGEGEPVEQADIVLKFAPLVFVYFLWMSVFIAAQMLLTNTVEEKSNRIIEVLLSSVSPSQLMHGKIYGIALTGLTIVGSWAVFFIAGVKLAPHVMPSEANMITRWGLDQIVSNPAYTASFLVYFLAGYLLYAAILVAIGSVCNSLKEAQNLQQPVILLLMVPFATMFPIVSDPNGTLAKAMTYIPLYTPFAMMNRAGGPPPPWEYVASGLVIVVSLLIAFWGAGKVFRVGILMTGKPPRLTEILRWMRPGS